MKKVMIVCVMLMSTLAFAQSKVDEDRMQRDIEVAENILSTLIKQQLGKRSFFPMEVQGNYLPGYGVTFHLPTEFFGNMIFMQGDGDTWNIEGPPIPDEPAVPGEPAHPVKSYSYSYSTNEGKAKQEVRRSGMKGRSKVAQGRSANSDSSRAALQRKTFTSR